MRPYPMPRAQYRGQAEALLAADGWALMRDFLGSNCAPAQVRGCQRGRLGPRLATRARRASVLVPRRQVQAAGVSQAVDRG